MNRPLSARWQRVALAVLGVVLTIAANTRHGVAALAWVAPVPFLLLLRRTEGWLGRLAVTGWLTVGWVLATMKIVTAPVPLAIAVGYGLPIALVHAPAFFLWDALAKRRRDGLAIASFAALSALAEWGQAELTPFGVWGSAPASQASSLPLLQVLALAGMPGLSMLMHATAATIEATVSRVLSFKPLAAVAATVAVLLAWGTWRIEQPLHGASVRAAAIRTDSRFTGLPIAPRAERARIDDALFARTADAARAGAKLVSWTEAATLVLPDEERELTDAAAAAARALGIELVISYIMPLQLEPLRYENRLRWFSSDGTERLAYLKHHPVPGEPAVPGAAPAPVLHTSIGPASAAICYDLDFPALGRALARSGAGIVVVPSSDWRGIDPVHTHMAALRAIEGGYSVLRAARWGLTAGIDAHGTLVGQMSTNGGDEPFLLVTLPVAQRPTLYAALGNLVLVPLVGMLLAGLFALRPARGRRERNTTTPALTGARGTRDHSARR